MQDGQWTISDSPKPPPTSAAPKDEHKPKAVSGWTISDSATHPEVADDLAMPTVKELSASNPQKEGTYRMKGSDGTTYGVPYSNVESVENFRNNFVNEDEAQRYEKDHKGDGGPNWRDRLLAHTAPMTDTEKKKLRSGDEAGAGDADFVITTQDFTRGLANGAGTLAVHPWQSVVGMVQQARDAGAAILAGQENWNKHPGEAGTKTGDEVLREKDEFKQMVGDLKKQYKTNSPYVLGQLVGQAIAAKKFGELVKVAPKAVKAVPETFTESMKNRAGTGVHGTEKLVRDTDAGNVKAQTEGLADATKDHAEKVKQVESDNQAKREAHAKALEEHNEKHGEITSTVRKLNETKSKLVPQDGPSRFKVIQDSAKSYFDKKYDNLSKLIGARKAPLEDLAEGLEEARGKLEGSDTKVAIFDDIERRIKGEASKGETLPDNWRDMSPSEQKDWRAAKSAEGGGISFDDLRGYYRELGKVVGSDSTAPDVKQAAVHLRETLDKMQADLAKKSGVKANSIYKSVSNEYKDYAQTMLDRTGPKASPVAKALSAPDADNALKHFEGLDPHEKARALDLLAGRGKNAEWLYGEKTPVEARVEGGDPTARVGESEKLRNMRNYRLDTEKMVRQYLDLQDERAKLGKGKPLPQHPELDEAPKFEPPEEKTLSRQDLANYKRVQLNKKIDSLEANGMHIGPRGLGIIGAAELLSWITGGSPELKAAIAGGGVAAGLMGPKIFARLLKIPGVAEKLLRITKADEEALAKLPANQRVVVEENIIGLTQHAKAEGIIKPSDPTPLMKFAKQDLPKAKAEAAKPEPPKEEPPAAAPAPAPEPPPAPPAPVAATAPSPAASEPAPPTLSRQGAPIRRLEDLTVDPKRFQYKLGGDKKGVTDALTDAAWDQSLADPIHTWVDPADGKEYVVNGHHRYELAQRGGAEHIEVNPIDNKEFPTAEDARRFGALKNIADGTGTAVDAAKFFRDKGYTPADLKKTGLSLKKSVANEGMALARLNDDLFDRVVDGRLDPKIGAAIGEATELASDQEAILKDVTRKEKAGTKVTPDQIRESARLVKSAPSFNQTTQDLFGEHNETRNLFVEMGEVSDYIQKQLASEKRVFGSVSDKARGEQLSKGGNVIKPEENAKIANSAAQQRELYSKRSLQAGPIHSALQEAAERLAEGDSPNEVKQSAYKEIREHLAEELGESE